MAREKKSDRDKKKVDAAHDESLEGRHPQDILNGGGLYDQLKKRLVERAFEGEITGPLGYGKYAVDGRGGGSSRNGKTRNRVKVDDAEIEIEVPRDRDTSFEPQIVPKGRTRWPGFDDKVIALSAHGLTTHELQSRMKESPGADVSPSLIPAVIDSVLKDVKAWQSRSLDAVYPIVCLGAIRMKIRASGHVQNAAVCAGLAINLEGNKELLGLWVGENEGARFWLLVLTELQNRGVQDILIVALEGLQGFPEAIEADCPRTNVQLCLLLLNRNSLRFVPWIERKKVAVGQRAIFIAVTRRSVEQALDAFEHAWDDEYPMVVKRWWKNWSNLLTFFDYPSEIRKVIYMINAIESINPQLRKVVKKRDAVPTEDPLRKVTYLAMTRAVQRWSRPIKDWKKNLDHLALVVGGCVPP